MDPSWLQVDFGSPQSFNTVIIDWQAAYATQYQIQYTNGDPTVESNWLTATTNNAVLSWTHFWDGTTLGGTSAPTDVIDYAKPCIPSLSPADQAWADELIRQASVIASE